MITEWRFSWDLDFDFDRSVRISDNFGGDFEETDNGWNARLNPPLQLMLVISL